MNMDKLSQVTPGVYKIEENYVGEAMKNLRENQLIIQGDIFWHSHETKKVKLMKRASYLVGYNPFMKMDYDYLIELKSLLEICLKTKILTSSIAQLKMPDGLQKIIYTRSRITKSTLK
jgi:hypothetical protein